MLFTSISKPPSKIERGLPILYSALARRNQEIDEMFMSLYADKAKRILTEQRFLRMTENSGLRIPQAL